jgi:hypothetical protein
VQPNELTEVLKQPISQELLADDVTRLAYVAKDGTPRNVPIGFPWSGSEIVISTSKNAPKLRALSENPMVALTIDTDVHPPTILLILGRAELDFVDGIPDEYLRATLSCADAANTLLRRADVTMEVATARLMVVNGPLFAIGQLVQEAFK